MNFAGNHQEFFLPLENLQMLKGVKKHKQLTDHRRQHRADGFHLDRPRLPCGLLFKVTSLVFSFISFFTPELFKKKKKIGSHVTADPNDL